jgi:hypothetical protein
MKKYDLNIHVNQKAFKAEDINDVLNVPIAELPIPEFRGPLSLMLEKVLARLPAKDPVFIIRDGVIEITTKTAFLREFYRQPSSDAPLQPLVHAAIVNVPLTTALRDLARAHGGNVVVDVRAAKEAATTVTADFANVPLDTAVALLADMCGLTTVEVGNVIYVTSKENGRALQQDQKLRRLDGPEKPDAPK